MEVALTGAAREILKRIKAKRDNLVFVFDDGCCEGTAPLLFDHYIVDPEQIQVGEIDDVSIYASPHVHGLYEGRRVVIDVDYGQVSDSLSVETGLGCRFVML